MFQNQLHRLISRRRALLLGAQGAIAFSAAPALAATYTATATFNVRLATS